MDLELSIALTNSVFSRPLIDGRVSPQGIRLIPTSIHASEMYWRQLRFADFDVSEMSLSSLFISHSRGDTRWMALPIFTMRRFFHIDILVRSDAGITKPSDLKGKRVAVPEYQQTSAVWCRGVLEHEFGVHARDMSWFMERSAEKSHGGATGFQPPDGIQLNKIPSSTNIGELMIKGELDATLLYLNEANLVDRSRVDVTSDHAVRRLFPDPQAEGRRYYAKTGIYPINHVLVVKASLVERYPWIALNLFSAFAAAKAEVQQLARSTLQPFVDTGCLNHGTDLSFSDDPMPYGFKAAEPVLKTIAQYAHEQGLTGRLMRPEEIFVPSTHDV